MTNPVGPNKRLDVLASGTGGFVAVAMVMFVSDFFVGDGAPFVMTSLGSSAVVLFGAPAVAQAQPRAVAFGHLLGALAGVTCAQFLGTGALSASLAVAVTMVAMFGLDLVHPPAGATAFGAVVGGAAITDLGYRFVLTPVALNVAILLAMAVIVNALIPWRRYPAVSVTTAPTGKTMAPAAPAVLARPTVTSGDDEPELRSSS